MLALPASPAASSADDTATPPRGLSPGQVRCCSLLGSSGQRDRSAAEDDSLPHVPAPRPAKWGFLRSCRRAPLSPAGNSKPFPAAPAGAGAIGARPRSGSGFRGGGASCRPRYPRERLRGKPRPRQGAAPLGARSTGRGRVTPEKAGRGRRRGQEPHSPRPPGATTAAPPAPGGRAAAAARPPPAWRSPRPGDEGAGAPLTRCGPAPEAPASVGRASAPAQAERKRRRAAEVASRGAEGSAPSPHGGSRAGDAAAAQPAGLPAGLQPDDGALLPALRGRPQLPRPHPPRGGLPGRLRREAGALQPPPDGRLRAADALPGPAQDRRLRGRRTRPRASRRPPGARRLLTRLCPRRLRDARFGRSARRPRRAPGSPAGAGILRAEEKRQRLQEDG